LRRWRQLHHRLKEVCCNAGFQLRPMRRAIWRWRLAACLICEDERQFVMKGQQRSSRDDLASAHKIVLRDDLGIVGLGLEPSFAIDQRALLLRKVDSCVMWDLRPARDAGGGALGGLKAIAVSHPHSMARSPTAARPLAAFRSISQRRSAVGHPVAPRHRRMDRRQLPDHAGPCARRRSFCPVVPCCIGAWAPPTRALFTGGIAMAAMDRVHLNLIPLRQAQCGLLRTQSRRSSSTVLWHVVRAQHC